ncbi:MULTISPECIES: hypothetical protein [Elizabethkingia]|uniref:hypothetical protein n=1 Tax=Elizabethkingia TaxID=308865 RepID=UPI000998F30C|nr:MULTISPECIES: hypothetical protein [Elizabethkingia]MDX8569787.1 hypothetical protein [Elizabethkingia sp. HX XZB]MDX8573292.1 hypothetical protein [Elizabethkingia sp. HX QKY]OPC11659.1 hypothetical protein BAY01_11545 [Elizabethkingia miricola]
MKVTRIYNDSNGDSHFEDVTVALSDCGPIGFLSQNIKVSQLQFRKVSPDYDYDFHCAPQKQYIVLLDGGVEIETSLGQKRVFQSGEVLWVEDTIGKGHKTKNLEHKERTSLFIHID